jgi:hypothetical protein
MSAIETPPVRLAPEALGKRTRCGSARKPLESEADSARSGPVRLEESPPGTELRMGAGLALSGEVRTTGPLELDEVVGCELERLGPISLEPRGLGEERIGLDEERLGLGEE